MEGTEDTTTTREELRVKLGLELWEGVGVWELGMRWREEEEGCRWERFREEVLRRVEEEVGRVEEPGMILILLRGFLVGRR